LRVGSVDAFQGKEFDVVILSIVRSHPVRGSSKATDLFGFAAVENRMCVALSRQKKLLIVVGDKSMAASRSAAEIVGMNSLVQLCEEENALNQIEMN
jgi:superfamily I DNA and/or RNA helicase